VSRELADSCGAVVTFRAGVWLIPCVYEFVRREIGGPCGAVVASLEVAGVWLLHPGVYEFVLLEAVGLCGAVVASLEVAGVWLHPCVYEFVSREIDGLCGAVVTFLAGVWTPVWVYVCVRSADELANVFPHPWCSQV